MKEAVFKVEINDDKVKNKVLKTINGLPGVDSVSMDGKHKKLTVIGDIDLLSLLSQLRMLCQTDILTVGRAKKPARNDDEKKRIEEPVRAPRPHKMKRRLVSFLFTKLQILALLQPFLGFRPETSSTTLNMKKLVLRVGVYDDKVKNKVLKSISRLAGVDSVSMDMKEKKLTVIGDNDPPSIVVMLRRKVGYTEIVCVGPAKEPEKEDDEKEKKAVFKVGVDNDKVKDKVLRTISGLAGSISIDMNGKKLTVIGATDLN